MTLQLQLVEGLLEQGLLSTEVWLSLKQLYSPSYARSITNETLLNFLAGLHFGIAKPLANLMHYHMLKSFSHFAVNENLTDMHYTHKLAARN